MVAAVTVTDPTAVTVTGPTVAVGLGTTVAVGLGTTAAVDPSVAVGTTGAVVATPAAVVATPSLGVAADPGAKVPYLGPRFYARHIEYASFQSLKETLCTEACA